MRFNLGKRNRKFLWVSSLTLFVIIALKSVVVAIEADVSDNWRSIVSKQPNSAAITAVNVKNSPSFPCGSMQNRIDRGQYAEIVSVARDGDFEYQMWEFSVPDIPSLIGVTRTNIDRSVCIGTAITGYEPPGTPITESLRLPIARELILGALRTQIERDGGVEAYQEALTASFYTNAHGYATDADGNAITDEQFPIDSVFKWALDQVGIVLPEGRYYVVDIDGEYKY